MGWLILAIPMAVGYGAQKVTATVINKLRKRKEEETRKLLECKINEAFQELKGEMKALQKYLQKLRECRQKEHQLLSAYLEENQGKEEEEISRALVSSMTLKLQQLFQRIESLEEDLQELLKSSQHEFQLLRAGQK